MNSASIFSVRTLIPMQMFSISLFLYLTISLKWILFNINRKFYFSESIIQIDFFEKSFNPINILNNINEVWSGIKVNTWNVFIKEACVVARHSSHTEKIIGN